ncbi:venom toxin OcyC11-like [Zootermopsis nevadensis]|uniref:Single domain-containing protein n=1 Tax=Zootermopsis nevadensis TaxID=136037 RepID=A0A067R599_ZOONE|nr:venom toxin OcyC11-like [Zootermopsis nevadensis]XP_021923836.1 venom toxin OcyC11-like [Zootermopsis nevadensis]XP_021923837.1 venom toxin OcyC11-like [Zootermopsis nevadensis]XP_021923838.1 venom toxin OcyC11-like [Zootermopsis nevadensis]KDR17391.1 hypothetical protein L798_07830 [Zootermopsis nevadensis]
MQVCLYLPIFVISGIWFPSTVEGAVAMMIVEPNEDHPGKCYDPETERAYAVGEKWRIGTICVEYSCSTWRENKFRISLTGCGFVKVEPPCTVVEDSGSAFPDCCPKPLCPNQSRGGMIEPR